MAITQGLSGSGDAFTSSGVYETVWEGDVTIPAEWSLGAATGLVTYRVFYGTGASDYFSVPVAAGSSERIADPTRAFKKIEAASSASGTPTWFPTIFAL